MLDIHIKERAGHKDFDRSVPRKPRPVGGVKGHNTNNKSLPGSPRAVPACGRQARVASQSVVGQKRQGTSFDREFEGMIKRKKSGWMLSLFYLLPPPS
jgi:hypothetical protein